MKLRNLTILVLLIALGAYAEENPIASQGFGIAQSGGRVAKPVRYEIPNLKEKIQMGGSGVGNGGLWLGTQFQIACERKLIDLLLHPINDGLLSKEDRENIVELIRQKRIPFELVDPKALPKRRYWKPQGGEANVRNGRLLDHAEKEVDARIVLDGARDFRLVVQMDEDLWTLYTAGGLYFPDYLMSHIFHEILRYAWYTEVTSITDDESVVSGRLRFPPSSTDERSDARLTFLPRPFDPIQLNGEIYEGTIPCGLMELKFSKEPTDSIVISARNDLFDACKVRLTFKNTLRLKEIEGIPIHGDLFTETSGFGPAELEIERVGKPETRKTQTLIYTQSGTRVLLEDSEKLNLEAHLMRDSQMLSFGLRMLYRVGKKQPVLSGKEFLANLFCDDIDFALNHVHPLGTSDYPGNHLSSKTCWLAVEFQKDFKVRISKFKDGEWESKFLNYTQIGNNILVDQPEAAFKIPGDGLYFYVDEKTPETTLTTNSGETLFRRGLAFQPMLPQATGKKYMGFARCGQVHKPFTEDHGVCQVLLEFTNQLRGESKLVRVGSRRVKPYSSDTDWTIGTYVQVGTQLQTLVLGSGRALSYKVQARLLVNEFGTAFQLWKGPNPPGFDY